MITVSISGTYGYNSCPWTSAATYEVIQPHSRTWSTYSVVLVMVDGGHEDGRIQRRRHQVAAVVESGRQLGRVHALRHHVVVAVDVVAVQRTRQRQVVRTDLGDARRRRRRRGESPASDGGRRGSRVSADVRPDRRNRKLLLGRRRPEAAASVDDRSRRRRRRRGRVRRSGLSRSETEAVSGIASRE